MSTSTAAKRAIEPSIFASGDHLVCVAGGEPAFTGALEDCLTAARELSKQVWSSKVYIYRRETFSGYSKWLHIKTASKGQVFSTAAHHAWKDRNRTAACLS